MSRFSRSSPRSSLNDNKSISITVVSSSTFLSFPELIIYNIESDTPRGRLSEVRFNLNKDKTDDDMYDCKITTCKVRDRVVRGPDWEWSNQDGGQGRIGTILEIHQGADKKLIRVKWLGLGRASYYRWGRDGKYDVMFAYSKKGHQMQFQNVHKELELLMRKGTTTENSSNSLVNNNNDRNTTNTTDSYPSTSNDDNDNNFYSNYHNDDDEQIWMNSYL
eukprot:gene8644-17830_t